jgi:hypothetical protein
MSQPKIPEPAKLIIGVFLKNRELFSEIYEKLNKQFGPVDIVSAWFSFDYTSYYELEMGTPLFRRMLAFKKLMPQPDLVDAKLFTNEIEKHYSDRGARKVNIDPGYLLGERFVLATGKNFTHRIYLDKGIFADLTLIYQKGDFVQLPWTYQDYASDEIILFLKQVRGKFLTDRRNKP